MDAKSRLIETDASRLRRVNYAEDMYLLDEEKFSSCINPGMGGLEDSVRHLQVYRLLVMKIEKIPYLHNLNTVYNSSLHYYTSFGRSLFLF
ncbi:hypothetical protein CEXT_205891 [Caerostris extrusa]|uniref:Uncharacterized protein n=1 Tax=Caerostris extrusa TaxID=172846 RepID=A0AAV4TP82_CAEEX|nr:hypothetical protein CEXT_205891 [Caerostris extrusa]